MLFCWPHARTRKDEQDSSSDGEEEESHHQFPLPPPVISIGRNNLNPRNPFSNCLPKKQDATQESEEEERKTPVVARAVEVEPPPPPPPLPPGRAATAAAVESLEEEKDLARPRVAAISTQSTMTTTTNSDSSSSTSPPSPLRLRDLDSCAPSGMSSTMSHMMDGNTSFGSTTEDDQISAGALTPSVSNCYYGGSTTSSIRSSSLAIHKTTSGSLLNSDSWLLEEQEHEDSTREGGDESSLGDSWEPIVPDLEDEETEEKAAGAIGEPITPARAAYYESVAKHQPLQSVTPPPSVILSHKMVISPPSPPPASPPEPYFNKPKSIPESTTLKPSARVQRFYKDVTPTKSTSVNNSTKAFLVVFVAALLFGVLGAAGFWDNALNLHQQPPRQLPLTMKKPAYASTKKKKTKSTSKKSSHYNSTTAPTTRSSSSSSFNVTEVQEAAMNYFSLPSFSSVDEEDEVVIDDSIFDLSPAQLADAATNGPFLLSKPASTTRQRKRTRSSRISGRTNKAQEAEDEVEEEEERTIIDWVAERYQRLNVYVLGQSQLAQLKRKQFQFGQSSIGSLA